nr:protein kinase [Vibrio sp. Of7-15]
MVKEPLGRAVYIAYDLSHGKTVVIKQAKASQLQKEWQCLSMCHSPYIIKAGELCSSASLLTLPYLDGQSLLSFSSDQAHLFLSLLPQLVRAIDHVHQQGWIHGDIKPSNVMYLANEHKIQLIDFGSCLSIGTKYYDLDEWQLTPGFSTQDQLQGNGHVLPSYDWFALKQWLSQLDANCLSDPELRLATQWSSWLQTKVK